MISTYFNTRGVGCPFPEGGIASMNTAMPENLNEPGGLDQVYINQPGGSKPIPVLGWDAKRQEWLEERRKGISASDVAILLGFVEYEDCSPYDLWLEKTGRALPKGKNSEAIEIGNDLEPILRIKANKKIGKQFTKTIHQLYRHPEHEWMMCSPDGQALDVYEGLELKTGAQATWGNPQSWDEDQTPLAYEFQCIWQNIVMDWEANNLLALIGTRGYQVRRIERNPETEATLIEAVTEWYQRHIVEDIEPDGATYGHMLKRFPKSTGEPVELPAEAALKARALKEVQADIKDLTGIADELKAELAAMAGEASELYVDGELIATWREKRASPSWKNAAQHLIETTGTVIDIEQFWGEPTRQFTLKIKDAA